MKIKVCEHQLAKLRPDAQLVDEHIIDVDAEPTKMHQCATCRWKTSSLPVMQVHTGQFHKKQTQSSGMVEGSI